MSTTDPVSALTTIYSTILHRSGLNRGHADRVVAEVAERVELLFDMAEVEDFIVAVLDRHAQGGYALDVAAVQVARDMVPDVLVETARQGGREAVYPGHPAPIDDPRPAAEGDRRSAARTCHPIYADYFFGVAAELDEGDGIRVLNHRHAATTADLDRPLVVTRVETLDDLELIAVTVMDRSSMVHEAMGNLPDAVAEFVDTLVFATGDRVLIRF